MVNKSNFLKKLLTTASVLAVTASAGNAMAQARVTTAAGPATQAGAGLDQTVGPINAAVTAGSTITIDANGRTYSTGANPVDLAAINVRSFTATLDAAASGAGTTFNLGSVIKDAGSNGGLTINTGVANPSIIVLTGTATAVKPYVAPVVGAAAQNWNFVAPANDYSGLAAVNFQNAGDVVSITSAATLPTIFNGAGAGEGRINVNANVIFSGAVGNTNAVGTLDIKDGKSATLGKIDKNSINDILIGAGSTLTVGAGANVASNAVNSNAAGVVSTLSFAGASTAAIDKIGDSKALKFVTIGDGTVDLAATTYKVETTKLTHANAVLNFTSVAVADPANSLETDFTTTSDKGKVKFAGDHFFKGNIGTAANALDTVQIGANKLFVFRKDEAKVYARAITTETGNTGVVGILSKDFEIHSDIGEAGKKLALVAMGGTEAVLAGNGVAGTVKLYGNVYATGFDLSYFDKNAIPLAPNPHFDNVLELYEGSGITANVAGNDGNGIISVKGTATIDGQIGVEITGINATPVGGLINQIRFDAANTLTATKNTINTENGINFLQDGTLALTENASLAFDKNVVVAADVAGRGTITVNNVAAGAGKLVEFTAVIGDVTPATNKSLKLLEVTGGANIKLSADAAIKKIDIGTQNSTLELNATNFLIGEFAHADTKGTLKISKSMTLVEGTVISNTVAHRLAALDLGNITLTVGNGINIFTENTVGTGGVRNAAAGNATLIFDGNSTVGASIGTNHKFGNLEVRGNDKTVTFLEKINITDLIVSEGATAVLKGEVVAANIQGAVADKGTVKFENTAVLAAATSVDVAIGAVTLDTVELAGADITFKHADFSTNNLKFTKAGDLTVTFTALAANALQDTKLTTTSTTRQHNVVLSAADHQFDQAVGTEANPFGNFTIVNTNGSNLVTINEKFYGSIITDTKHKGRVEFTGADRLAINVGSATKELELVTFAGSATILEGIWSKNIAIEDGVTATFKGVTSASVKMSVGNGSTALFSGPNVELNTALVNTVAGQHGNATFDNAATITKDIGTQASRFATIAFTGAAGQEVKVGADLAADNINVGAGTLTATVQNVRMYGNTNFTGSTIDLGHNKITFKDGTARTAGDVTVKTVFTDSLGQFVADGANSTITIGGNMNIIVTDNAVLPTTDKDYDLFTKLNKGTITALAANNTVTVSTANNRFIDWSLNNAKDALTRKNIAGKVLEGIFVKESSELRELALNYADTKNTGDAQAFLVKELATITEDAVLIEAVNRITETTATQAPQVVDKIASMIDGSISNRITAISAPSIGGVSAGEGDSMFGAWISPFYGTTTQSSRGNNAGYETNSYGGIVGFDTQASSDLTLGIAGAYAKTDVKHKNFKSGDKTKADTFLASIYGIQQLTDNWLMQGHGTFSSTKSKSSEKRITGNTTSETAKGSYDTTAYTAEVLAGYNQMVDSAVVTPMVGASFTRINIGGYKETGTTNQNLNISGKALNKLEGILGLKAHVTSDMEGMQVTPEIHAFVRQDFIGNDSKVTAKHDGLATTAKAKVAKAQRTTFNFGVGVNANAGMYEYGVGYDLYAAEKSLGHQGALKVRVNF